MPDQKKRGFHALEDRIHELEEEDAKQRESASERQVKEAGAERGSPRPSEESSRTKK
jgi:hypothetical protein